MGTGTCTSALGPQASTSAPLQGSAPACECDDNLDKERAFGVVPPRTRLLGMDRALGDFCLNYRYISSSSSRSSSSPSPSEIQYACSSYSSSCSSYSSPCVNNYKPLPFSFASNPSSSPSSGKPEWSSPSSSGIAAWPSIPSSEY